MPGALPQGPASSPPPPWWARWRSRRVIVHDQSMTPTLLPGDRLLVETGAYRERLPIVGELIVMVDPADPRRWLVKRVAAVGPGRSVRTGSGDPGRAGFETDPTPPTFGVDSVDLPDRTVYVLGDAGGVARDSRQFGPVPLDRVVGRVY